MNKSATLLIAGSRTKHTLASMGPRSYRRLMAAGLISLSTVVGARADTVIVLDASGSMWGQIDGVNKITIAQDVVADVLESAPGDRSLGLLAYGHRRKGDCGDIELLVPPSPGTGASISSATSAINPRGKTPLTEAVRQAARVLKSEEQTATVVLVTDGLETCGADPCALARELEQSGLDFTTHVVGFGLSRTQGAGVACLADETGGQYFQANNASDLSQALSQTIARADGPAPEPVAPPKQRPKNNLQINVQITADSPPLEEGQIQRLDLRLLAENGAEKRLGGQPVQALTAEPGAYTLRALYEGGQAEMAVNLEEYGVTHATLILNAGRAEIQAISLSQTFELAPSLISWRVRRLTDSKRFDIFTPRYDAVLGTGRYEVQAVVARKPEMSPPPIEISITPGEVYRAQIDLPNGRFSLKPVTETGEALPDSHIRFSLHEPKSDGSAGRHMAGAAGARFPLYALPGDYVLVIEDWGISKRSISQALSIGVGETIDLKIVLPSDPNLPLPNARR